MKNLLLLFTLFWITSCSTLTTIPVMNDATDKVANYKTVNYKSVTDKISGKEFTLKLHIFTPKNHQISDPKPAIVFFFGGGWNSGTATQFYPQSQYLASRGMVAICAEYRIKQKHSTSPKEAVADAKSAVRWIRSNAKEFGVIPSMIAAGGGSAGGHLAAATATLEKFNAPNEDLSVSNKPNALVLFNPVFDNGPTGYGYERVKDYWSDISPLHNIKRDMPPALVLLGTKDKYIPVTTAKLFKDKMEKQGVRSELVLYKDQPHGFFNKSKYHESLNEVDRFLTSLGYLK